MAYIFSLSSVLVLFCFYYYLLLLLFFFCLLLFSSFFLSCTELNYFSSLISSITGYLARLTPMVISGSQHPLKVDYSILKYIIHLWVNKILVVVVVVGMLHT